jgi:hypothetical protein
VHIITRASLPRLLFAPFRLSEASGSWEVFMKDGVLRIGCHHYDYKWTRYALWKILTQKADKVGALVKTPTGVSYSKLFNIMQTDVDNIYSALCTLE